MNLLEYNMGEGVRAFSTTREGGVSVGAYAAFNITHYCGDEASAVVRNRALLCRELSIDDSRLILPRQTHGTEIRCIDEEFLSLPPDEQSKILYGVDAVVTNIPRLCIGVSTADCVPIIMHDATRRVAAAVHAGWRGTVARITEKALSFMADRFGTRAGEVRAVIAPSISLAAFEVGDEVYDTFAAADFPMQKIAQRYSERWHIDLWEANRLQLTACGVPEQAITVAGICTYSNCDKFFSARRSGINSGRIFSGIMLE